MKKKIVYIKTLLFLLILGLVFGFTSRRNEQRKLQGIEVSFNQDRNLFLTTETVNNLLIQNIGELEKQSKSSLNLQELESLVISHPMVSSADVSVDVLGKINVEIVQRKPLARILNAKEIVYLDADGQIMPLSDCYSARVPIIYNNNGLVQPQEVFPLIQKIHTDDFLRKLIVAIKKDQEGYWLTTRIHHQQVLLGELKGFQKKLKNLKVFYAYQQKDSMAATFKKIDIQYNNQIVCSK